MIKIKKAKSIAIAFFTIIMAVCFVIGVNSISTNVKAEGETTTSATAWQTSRSIKMTELKDSGLQYSTQSATVMNTTNLYETRDVIFQFMSSGQDDWGAFVFLNGQTNWTMVNWPGINQDCDTNPHIIIKDSAGQIFGNGANNEGVRNVSKISDQLHTVTIHIGTGDGDDISFIKMDGNMLLHEHTDNSAIDWLEAKNFKDNGCYFAYSFHQKNGGGEVTLFGEYNAPYVEYSTVNSELNSKIDLSTGESPTDVSFTVKNVTGTAKLTVNGVDVVDANTYRIEDDATVSTTKVVTIQSAFWTRYLNDITRTTLLTVVGDNGKASVYTTVQKTVPPVWDSNNYFELEEIADVECSFTYATATGTIAQDDIIVKTGIKSATSDPLTAGSDYTLTENDGTYTFTLKQTYLATQITDAYRSLKFTITIGEDSLEGALYCVPEGVGGWYARTNDLANGTSVEIIDGTTYQTATLRPFSESTLSSRIYYTFGFDVTEPITLEVSSFTDANLEWALLGVMSDLRYMDYFSDQTANIIPLTALFFGNNRNDIQKLGGFVVNDGDSTNANYDNLPNIKNVVIEIFFGATSNTDGYFKVNGKNLATPSAMQADFESGFAYVGFFFNQKSTNLTFTANAACNGIAITGPVASSDETSYTIDIANPDKDLVLDVINTDGTNLSISCNGTVAETNDYSYENGKLTIKQAFFKKLSFAKSGTLIIKHLDEESELDASTQIYLTFTSSNMEKSHIVFATKGSLSDAVFNLTGYNSIDYVLKGENKLANTEYTFANDVLTIKKENITDEKGATEFLAVSGEKIIPLYVYVDSFANGYAKTGDGTTQTGNDAYLLTSANNITPMKAYDFNTGFTMKIEFKSTSGYYKSGLEYANAGYVLFNFYDPYSGITLTYYVYTNFGENVTANDTALYETFYMTDSEGNKIILDDSRTVNIANSTNANALGVHVIKFSVNASNNIVIQIDNARALTISDSIGTFNLGASVLTISTPASNGSNEMKVAIKEYGTSDTVDYNAISISKDGGNTDGGNTDSGKTEEKKSGCSCSSAITVSIMMIPAIIIMGIILIVKKKKEENR